MTDQNKNEKQGRSVSTMLKSFDEISFFRIENLIRNIPFFLFIVIIAIFYIWNNNKGVAMERDLKTSQQELLESQYYFNATKDSLTQNSRQSAIAGKVDTLRMQELSQPPYTIRIGNNQH